MPRAWVLNEELLPRRLIGCGLRWISWECLEQKGDEIWLEFGRCVGEGRWKDTGNHKEAIGFSISSLYVRNKG